MSGDLFEAAKLANSSIFSRSDARKCLTSVNVEKDNHKRLFSWLITLEIIPEGKKKFAENITALYTKYTEYIEKYKDLVLEEKEDRVIGFDIKRSIHWFTKMSKETGLVDEDIKFASEHATRVLRTLSHYDSFFRYTQGFDRYVFLAYMLALLFTTKYDLPATVAEALSWHISEKLIRISNIHDLLNAAVAEKQFTDLDTEIQSTFPAIWNLLGPMGHNSFHFAMKWKLLLFADEHRPADIFLLWDHIILNKQNSETYVKNMCLAHVSQVPIDDTQIMLEKIQRFKDWNAPELVKYTNIRTIGPKETTSLKQWYTYIMAIAVFILMFAMAYERFKTSGF